MQISLLTPYSNYRASICARSGNVVTKTRDYLHLLLILIKVNIINLILTYFRVFLFVNLAITGFSL